ncbi:ubiquitin carboxyl-terminal hydrolase MINDY-1/2 [Sarotherodon galilaeus]
MKNDFVFNGFFSSSLFSTPVTTTTAEPVITKVLQFTSVGETFTPDLRNSSSPAFKNRSSLIVTTLEPIYNKTFSSYYSMEVTQFRDGSIITDIDIRFLSTSLPNNTDIEKVLINAAPNITAFNITNVVVIDSAASTVNTTTPMMTTVTVATTATPTTTTTAATTTAEPVRILVVQFRSVNGIFTTDLLTSSSTAFKQRSTLIMTTLEPFYLARFPSFRFISVTGFSNGSIINNMDIGFALSLVPNAKEIAQVLIDAAKITPFDIDISSILVDGILSHGVSHKISLLTASCMVLLSWLLSGQQ